MAQPSASQSTSLAKLTAKDLRQVFDLFDSDGSGAVDFRELKNAMHMLGVKCTHNSLMKVLTNMDTNGDQQIDWDEFQKFFKTVSDSDEIKQLLTKENQRYFEYKEMVENDLSFSKSFPLPPSKPATKKGTGHMDTVEKVAWLSDTQLVSASTDGGICTWDMLSERPQIMKLSGGPQTMRPSRRFNIDIDQTALYSMAASRSSQMLAVGLGSSSQNLSIWNVGDASRACYCDGHDTAVYACEFSMDDTQVASASQRGFLCVHDLERPDVPLLRWHPHTNVVHSVAFRHPNLERGSICTASADGSVKIFDMRTRNPANPSAPESVAEIEDAAASGPVYQAIWRGEREIITSGDDHCIKRWDQRAIKQGCLSAYFGHTSPVKTIGLSPDERFLVSGTMNGSIRIWLADEGGMLQEMKQQSALLLDQLTQKCNEQQEMFETGKIDDPVPKEEYKKMAELDREVQKYSKAHEERSSLGCTQACFSLDGPTVPMTTLAWRDVDGKAWIASGCQDPFVRLFDVDTSPFTDIAPWSTSEEG